MHGPTFMANPLACAAANASLDLFETGAWRADVARIAAGLERGLAPCRASPGVADVRVLGAIGVVEMDALVDVAALTARFADLGCWIRPMGKVIYLTPPLVIGGDDLGALTQAVVRGLTPI
jgi:adenosylmethionine-8-amino-7-oxononanoate aminotransferase